MNTMRGRMQRFRKTRFRETKRNSRAARIALGAISVGAAVMLAACSSSSSSTAAAAGGGSTPSSASGGGASASGGSSGSVDTAALTTAQAVPSFSQFAGQYGGKVDISSLKGKKVMIVPGVSAL